MDALKFVVRGKEYTINVPTPGDLIDIERMKQTLSNGFYGEMMRTVTVAAQESLMLIDVQSHFNVMCAELMKDLRCEDMRRASAEDYRELKTAYVKQFVPWWNVWLKLFRGEDGQ